MKKMILFAIIAMGSVLNPSQSKADDLIDRVLTCDVATETPGRRDMTLIIESVFRAENGRDFEFGRASLWHHNADGVISNVGGYILARVPQASEVIFESRHPGNLFLNTRTLNFRARLRDGRTVHGLAACSIP